MSTFEIFTQFYLNCLHHGCARYKHSAEKVQKMENVMEKYKKKLEESAELRRTVKVLQLSTLS